MNDTVILYTVLMMLLYIILGYVLVKSGKADASHGKTISAFLIYVCGPAMIINSFQSIDYTSEEFSGIALFFLVSLCVQALFFGILYLILHKSYSDAKYRILTIGAMMGNVGFFGLPVVTSLFPEYPIVSCYSMAYVMSMNLMVFTVGVFMITRDKKYISLKAAICNPTTLAILVALPIYFLHIHFSGAFGDALAVMSKMTTPLCMLVLGMRIASVSLKALFSRPFAYAACALKLIAFPLFAYVCVLFLPLNDVFKTSLVVLSCAPSGAVILSLAELHRCEQELSANVVMLTTLASVVTVPLLLMLF